MPDFISRIRTLVHFSAVAAGLLASTAMLSACDLADNNLKLDRDGHREMQDFRDGLSARSPETSEAGKNGEEGIPSLQPYVAQPSEKMKAMPLVSISVNQSVPLRDALYELADQAGYDLELDPRITGSIIFTAREKPFDMVIDRMAEIAGLRYKFDDDSVRVEIDTPYQKLYKIDYLSYIRKNKSSIRNDVSLAGGENANTGSAFEATGESEADFWGELSSNLEQILGVPETVSSLKTKADPAITAVQQNPAPVQQTGAATADGQPAQPGAPADPNATAAAAPPPAAAAPSAQPPQAVLQVQSLPTDPNASTESDEDKEKQKASFSFNRQAGMVSVFASERQHRKIAEYLNILRRSVTAQVLIEAKVLEVSLTDEFATGIDWSAIDKMGGELVLDFATSGTLNRAALSPTASPSTNFQIGYTGNDVSAVIDAISRFGTVHALASPRLTVLNNQSAVLNVANNLVYFSVDVSTSQSDSSTQTTVDSEIHNVPEGILINVQPSINLEDQTISMAVRPTITRVVSSVDDPAVLFAVAQAGLTTPITSSVPVVNVQEMDSLINLHSGQAVLMGGLMQDRAASTQQSVPVLGEVPVLGGLFRNQSDKVQKTELIVFLKATIIDGNGVSPADRDLYKKFAGDRSPLDM